MADAAWQMTNSIREVFGKLVVRLMCWSHTHRNYIKKLKSITEVNKKLYKSIDADIQRIQWMAQTNNEFKVLYELLESKYLKGEYSKGEIEQMDLFFSYFREQWGPSSHVCNWYEGAHPYHVGNIQGIESRNLAVKDDFSYRDQLNMTQFVAMMEITECSILGMSCCRFLSPN